ncbi:MULTISPECIES: aldo/keto reductase [Streptomyces]|uniref:Aldo/keto reductase n=1 Tax=Streptomyces mutomycini TaxID=284036 RepID=A0ABW0BAM8_9ACTN|nr:MULTISPECIES: aldo/keto reductase [Streptomyces]
MLGPALWSPLGGGLPTGEYRSSAEGRPSDLGMVIHAESTGQKTAVVDTVLTIAEKAGVAPAQVAVTWVRERTARSAATLVPIIGPRDLSQPDGCLGALSASSWPTSSTSASPMSARCRSAHPARGSQPPWTASREAPSTASLHGSCSWPDR